MKQKAEASSRLFVVYAANMLQLVHMCVWCCISKASYINNMPAEKSTVNAHAYSYHTLFNTNLNVWIIFEIALFFNIRFHYIVHSLN